MRTRRTVTLIDKLLMPLNMSAQEQEKLALFLSREGIRGFLTRLGINEAD